MYFPGSCFPACLSASTDKARGVRTERASGAAIQIPCQIAPQFFFSYRK